MTDFISFYSLPSTIIGNTKYQLLKAAYSFYNVAGATPWVTLMNDALILAKKVRASSAPLFAEVRMVLRVKTTDRLDLTCLMHWI